MFSKLSKTEMEGAAVDNISSELDRMSKADNGRFAELFKNVFPSMSKTDMGRMVGSLKEQIRSMDKTEKERISKIIASRQQADVDIEVARRLIDKAEASGASEDLQPC